MLLSTHGAHPHRSSFHAGRAVFRRIRAAGTSKARAHRSGWVGAGRIGAAQYVAKYTREYYYLWDELAAAALLDPGIITKQQILYVDVDTARGPNYGDTLSWTAANRPKYALQPVHVQVDLDSARFDKMLVELMKAPPLKP